ncbi:hypothetical protein GCM10022254_43030 [Actinomadura meridiana]|uniref:Secreted protein n=1 Tax=Actinomadura meridiana TaxID=559626 RepID=A0ABP8C929_9ACTN
MRAKILAGLTVAAALAAGPAAPALAAHAPKADACEAQLREDGAIVGNPNEPDHWGPWAAVVWDVRCTEARHLKVKIDYVYGRSVVSETDVEAGGEWRALDFTPSPDGKGENGYIRITANDQVVAEEAFTWD